MIPRENEATHRCTICKALWRLNDPDPSQPKGSPLRRDASWTLISATCGECCDNNQVVGMGYVEALPLPGVEDVP